MGSSIALLAGLVIFPLVFANGMDPADGPGLVFVTLPLAFGQMPGGVFFATIFFVLTTKKINGPTFRDNRVTGTMYLRKVDGAWKIYDQKISNVEYLD